MKFSLATSLGLHAAILVAALVVLPNPNPYNIKPQEAVMVDISKIGDQTKKMAMATDAPEKVEKPKSKKAKEVAKADPTAKIAEEEKKQAKVSKPKAAEEQPKPEEVKKEEPKEEPKKEEPKKAEDKPLDPDPLKDLIKDTLTAEEEAAKLAEKKAADEKKKAEDEKKKKAEEKKAAEAKKKAEDEKKKKAEEKKAAEAKKKAEKLDVAKLENLLNSDALLNKENEEKTTTASEATEDGNPSKGEVNLQGNDNELVGTIVDALVTKVKQCWNVPPGVRESGLVIRVHFALNPDGTLTGNPTVENFQADPLFDAAARSAVAALIECQAYSELPADRYDLWKDNTLDFDTKLMFQG